MDKTLFINNILSNTFIFQPENVNISTLMSVNNHKCLAPCYPAGYMYRHPVDFIDIVDEERNTCPTNAFSTSNKIIDECKDITKDYDKYDIFDNDYSTYLIAYNDDLFLKQVYDIKNISDVFNFLEINIETLQLLTQKRIIVSIYKVYINHDMFPNKLFITIIKNILKKIYEIDIHTTKIYKQIMKNKNKPIINDLFLFLFNKYNKKI